MLLLHSSFRILIIIRYRPSFALQALLAEILWILSIFSLSLSLSPSPKYNLVPVHLDEKTQRTHRLTHTHKHTHTHTHTQAHTHRLKHTDTHTNTLTHCRQRINLQLMGSGVLEGDEGRGLSSPSQEGAQTQRPLIRILEIHRGQM